MCSNLIPSKIEEWSSALQEEFLDFILKAVSPKVGKVAGVYLVGSVTFGRDSINDIDVCVVPESFEYHRDYRLNGLLTEFHGKPVDLKFRKVWCDREVTTDCGFLAPYYDLLNRTLCNKMWGAYMPFHFGWSKVGPSEEDRLLIALDSTKRIPIREMMEKSDRLMQLYKQAKLKA